MMGKALMAGEELNCYMIWWKPEHMYNWKIWHWTEQQRIRDWEKVPWTCWKQQKTKEENIHCLYTHTQYIICLYPMTGKCLDIAG